MRPSSRPLVILVSAVLLGAACTGGAATSPSTVSSASTAAGRPSGVCHGCGGVLPIGVGGWPTCLNPITRCADNPWYRYMFKALVFPRLTQWSNHMELEASPLTEELPSVENGGIRESPFAVTYHLNPKAVWHDGTPITCADVAFTWAAMLNTTGNEEFGPDPSGSDIGISEVRCPGSRTVTVAFNRPTPQWPDFFGGADGYVLERSVFSNAPGFPDRPDLKDAFKDSIPFSGGPWILIRWSTDQAIFVRNDHYWDRKPYIDEATFLPRSTSDQEAAIHDRDVDVVFQPAPTAVPSATLRADPALTVVAGPDDWVDALWFNLDDPVVGDPRIRQALAYAFDREAAAEGVPGLIDPDAKPNDCGPWVPGQGPWCPEPGPFAAHAYDAKGALALLKQAGYNCSKVVDGGLCTKDGKPLTITITTDIGDVGRATAVSLLETSALAAGVDVQLRTVPATDLYSRLLPLGRFQVSLYRDATGGSFSPHVGQVGGPSVSMMFSSNQIPTRANGYSGGNFVRWRNHAADALMRASDQELDQAKRARDIQAIGRLLARDLPMLPLYSTPSLAAWQRDTVAGVDPNDVSSPYGLFFGMNRWYYPG